MSNTNAITLGIIDDDSLIVELLSFYFKDKEEFEVLFASVQSDEYLYHLQENGVPNILLLDLKMKELDGIQITETLKEQYPDIRIIILSSHYKKSFMGFMIKTGAAAFLPKGIELDELCKIIKEVAQRGYFFMPEQMEVLRAQLKSKTPKPLLNNQNMLTEREVEILTLICQQLTSKEIGQKLFITARTVEGHKNNLFDKTGTKNIAGLVVFAIQNKIVNADDLPLF